MKGTVKVAIGDKISIDIADLNDFQGELKELTAANYERGKASILEHGFSFCPHVWDCKGTYYLIDGHQRWRILSQMRAEGFKVPKIPVIEVKANGFKDAKARVLAAASQYGRITSEGLYEFLHEADIDHQVVDVTYHFPEIDMDKFRENYFVDPPEMGGDQATTPPPRTDQGSNIEKFLSNDIRYIQLVFPIAEYDRVVARLDALCEEHGASDYSALVSKLIGVEIEKTAPVQEADQPGPDRKNPNKGTIRRRPG